MNTKFRLLAGITVVAGLFIVLLLTTTPRTAPLFVVLLPVALCGVFLYLTSRLIARYQFPAMSHNNVLIMSGVIAFLGMLGLVFATLGQLNPATLALMLVFGLLLGFYTSRK